MKYLCILFSVFVVTTTLSAQTPQVYTITADSTRLTGCDSNELIIENHTKTVPGFLYNNGNGRTIFKKALTKVNDTIYLIGGDTLKLFKSNAWLQGGNAFGATGKIGTKSNNSVDFITNNTQQMRLDSAGLLLLGVPPGSTNRVDVNGSVRVMGTTLASANDAYDIRMFPGYNNGFATGVNASMIAFGNPNIVASVGVNKQVLGNIPDGSLNIGGSGPGKWTTLTDYNHDPDFIVDGNGTATINGGFFGIGPGGATGVAANTNTQVLSINGGRGTGAGLVGDILFSTGTAQVSGSAIHAMTNRWWIKGGSGYLSDNASPTSSIDITGTSGSSLFRMRTTYTPTSSTDTNGNTGDFSWDVNYVYVKTASGWKRMALSTF